jgi:hypothetical protein
MMMDFMCELSLLDKRRSPIAQTRWTLDKWPWRRTTKKGHVMPDSTQPLNHFDYRNSAEADVVCKRNFYFWVC